MRRIDAGPIQWRLVSKGAVTCYYALQGSVLRVRIHFLLGQQIKGLAHPGGGGCGTQPFLVGWAAGQVVVEVWLCKAKGRGRPWSAEPGGDAVA